MSGRGPGAAQHYQADYRLPIGREKLWPCRMQKDRGRKKTIENKENLPLPNYGGKIRRQKADSEAGKKVVALFDHAQRRAAARVEFLAVHLALFQSILDADAVY